MQHVFNSLSDVAHTYAHPRMDDDHGRNGSDSMSFIGDTAYSYAAPVVRRVNNIDGDSVWLFASEYRGYSVSTSRHMREYERAVPGQMFDVPDIHAKAAADHVANWQALRSNVNAEVASVLRQREPRDSSLYYAERLCDTANRYASAFGIENRTGVVYCAIDQATRDLLADRIRQCEIRRDGRALRDAAKAEREAQAHRAAMVIEAREIARREFWHRLCPWLIGPAYRKSQPWNGSAETPKQKRDMVAEWRAGTRSSLPYRLNNTREDALLRVRNGQLETSGGIRIQADRPAIRARLAAWVNMSAAMAAGETIEPKLLSRAIPSDTGTSHSIDRYTATHIYSGCHGISHAEIRRAAIQLGLAKPTLRERIGL